MTYQNQQIRFLDKNLYQSNFIDKTLRELFYSDESNSKAFEKYKDIFFVGFEWNLEIKFKIVTSFADLDDNRLSFWRDKLKSNRSNDLNLTESLVAKKILSKAKSFLKKYKDRFFSSPFKNKKAKVSPKAIVEKKSLVSLGNNAEIQDYVIIKTFTSEVKIGEYSQLNPYTVIYGGVGVSIGNNVMIGPHCMIAAGTHDYIQVDKPMRFAGNLDKGPIIIDDDVWIGANCTISDGVHIGKGAVIGANSVVTKNVNAFDVVAGCPAKKIKNRLEKSRL
jgi:acetyltransferase-like isoleucine patch superfamily enzyme